MKIIRLSDMEVLRWSGGTTTELLIYPEGSSFSTGDFELRISIATVEQPQTIFTPLINTHRTLLVLEGTQRLEHQGHHSTVLKPLEQDSFSGSWTTHCKGFSTNFNVMTHGENSAEVSVISRNEGSTITVTKTDQIHFLYLLKGRLSCQGKSLYPEQGILLPISASLVVEKDAQLVWVTYPINSNY